MPKTKEEMEAQLAKMKKPLGIDANLARAAFCFHVKDSPEFLARYENPERFYIEFPGSLPEEECFNWWDGIEGVTRERIRYIYSSPEIKAKKRAFHFKLRQHKGTPKKKTPNYLDPRYRRGTIDDDMVSLTEEIDRIKGFLEVGTEHWIDQYGKEKTRNLTPHGRRNLSATLLSLMEERRRLEDELRILEDEAKGKKSGLTEASLDAAARRLEQFRQQQRNGGNVSLTIINQDNRTVDNRTQQIVSGAPDAILPQSPSPLRELPSGAT